MLPSSQPFPVAKVLFDQARAAQRANQPRHAEQLYRQLVEADPNHAQAWQGLAEVLQAQGKPADAVNASQNAVRLRPGSAEALYGLGTALSDLGRKDEAIATYQQLVRLWPQHAEGLTNLGVALAEQGELNQAVELLRQAMRVQPGYARAHQNLGVALNQLSQPDEAERCLREALRLNPDYVEALYNLGNVLGSQGRRDESIACYRQVLQRRPDHGGALNNLGLALTEAGKPGEAVVLLRQAIRLRPQAVEAHNNLGLALDGLGRFAEAEATYHEALRLDPRYAEAHSNLGNCLKEQGRLEEALASYQLALWLNPESASTHYNRALALLQAGDYEQGWPAYEWRWRRLCSRPRPFGQPRWDGRPLAGKTTLLWCEQGLGDTLMFVRYARLVREQGARVVLECPGFLLPLLSSCPGIDQLVAEGAALPEFDVQCPLLSLPGLLGTTLKAVPNQVPYLSAEPDRVEVWRQRLAGVKDFKVGIVWQGNPHFQWDRFRSLPLRCFAPLAAVEGVQLISLQKGAGTEQLRELGSRFVVTALGDELDGSGGGAFLDTAAVMANLDLVVTADTAAVHLAGALGVPVWVALAAVADWRWLREREETSWYPSMRLFRQAKLGDWQGVFAKLARRLRQLVTGKLQRKTVWVEMSPGELLDRLTILEIKSERMQEPEKLAQVGAELAALRQVRQAEVAASEELDQLARALKVVNERLWEAEDRLRLCEREHDFGEVFIELARSVYRHNDERAGLKRQINQLLGSVVSEQKAYRG